MHFAFLRSIFIPELAFCYNIYLREIVLFCGAKPHKYVEVVLDQIQWILVGK